MNRCLATTLCSHLLLYVEDEIEYARGEHQAEEMQQLVIYWESVREVGKPKNAQYDQHNAGQEEEPLRTEVTSTRYSKSFVRGERRTGRNRTGMSYFGSRT